MKSILSRLVKLVNAVLHKVGVKLVSVGTPLKDFTEFFAHLKLLDYLAEKSLFSDKQLERYNTSGWLK